MSEPILQGRVVAEYSEEKSGPTKLAKGPKKGRKLQFLLF